ncbi:unnamed protein product [Arctia plantaginis]|uniref:Uncharacterized protein n=1 Tax=Arctia plantaginis TaxID=874455 RepID=A0A8S1BT81_ARCPL|nr:unnamed protein product [Arctia plantaginis]
MVLGVGIRQRLFAKHDSVTFTQAVKLTSSLEEAERDDSAVEGVWREPVREEWVCSTRHRSPRLPIAEHNDSSCRFKGYTCINCQRVLHLRRVCPEYNGHSARGGSAQQYGGPRHRVHFWETGHVTRHYGSSEEDCKDIEESLNIIGLNRYKAVTLSVYIEDKVVNMEWRTGAIHGREGDASGTRPVLVFHRARPVPYALRERIDAELDSMLRAIVIKPDDCSD